jgi:hypothetical protein
VDVRKQGLWGLRWQRPVAKDQANHLPEVVSQYAGGIGLAVRVSFPDKPLLITFILPA